MPMNIKIEEEKTPPQTSLGPTQGSATSQNTAITRHNTRPLRDRRQPKFLGEKLFTRVVTSGSTSVNVVSQTQNTSDEEKSQEPKASLNYTPRKVNRSRRGVTLGLRPVQGTK